MRFKPPSIGGDGGSQAHLGANGVVLRGMEHRQVVPGIGRVFRGASGPQSGSLGFDCGAYRVRSSSFRGTPRTARPSRRASPPSETSRRSRSTSTSGYKNGYIPNLDEWKANVAAGVLLMVPLFNGHRTRHQEEEADANIRSAKARTADVERQVGSEVGQAITGVQSSLEKIENSAVQVAQAEAALARARAQYDAGVATNLDLLDVQTALSQAKLIRLRAIYEYMVSMNALDKATGKKIW